MDSFSRIVIKQGAGVPTVPASADHRNGDWIATDIYDGEFYLDTDSGLTYTRNKSGITLSDGSPTYKRFKAKISQSGTNAPTIAYTAINTLGITPTMGYSSVGNYTVTATGLFTLNKTYTTINQQLDHKFVIFPIDVNTVNIVSATGAYPAVSTNGFLFLTDIDIIIY
jgi:hypothetical protein